MNNPAEKAEYGNCRDDNVRSEELVHLMRSDKPNESSIDNEINDESNQVLSCDSSPIYVSLSCTCELLIGGR